MAELGPPFGGITRIRFKGFVYDVSAIRLPRNLSRETTARRAEVNASKHGARSMELGDRSWRKDLVAPRSLLRATNPQLQSPSCHHKNFVCFVLSMVKFYFAAVSALMLVWKMAIHLPFSCFQTE